MMLIWALGTNVMGQEFLALAWSDHTPTYSALYNPSLIADQRPKVDINLFGFGVHASNNTVYGQNKALIRWRTLDAYELNPSKTDSWAQYRGMVMGPGFSFTLKRHAFALNTSLRSAFSMHRVPLLITDFYTTNAWDTTATNAMSTTKTRMKALGWSQFGLSYASIVHQFDRDLVTLGATVNYLQGVGAAALYIEEASVTVVGNNIETVGSGRYAYAAPALNAGNGWSTSIGFTYKKMVNDVTAYVPHSIKAKCLTEPYQYKIAVSIADLGYIKMKHNAIYKSTDSLSQFMQEIEGGEIEDPQSLDADRQVFTVNLPTALVVMYDHRILKGVYANATVIQRMTTASMLGPERANVVAVGARIAYGHFGVQVPVSLINYKKPLLGLGLRLGPLSIGSDNVLPIFFRSDIYAVDFHATLHMRFWRGKGCRIKTYKGLKGFIMSIFKNPNKGYLEELPGW